MTIRSDSYSSTGEVVAFTRHLLEGQSAFNSTTRPTSSEVERFIDRASGVLNVALVKAGLSAPITNSTAKLSCSDWVTARAAEYVELTQRGAGFNSDENTRYVGFRNMSKSADAFAEENALGFKYLGVSVSHGVSDGLAFTGQDAAPDREDPEDTSLRQPLFRRGLFDEPSQTDFTDRIEEA